MKLDDALKSGKPFKRPQNVHWVTVDESPYFTTTEVLATDWVVKSEPRKWALIKQDGAWKVAKYLHGGVVIYEGNPPSEIVYVIEDSL